MKVETKKQIVQIVRSFIGEKAYRYLYGDIYSFFKMKRGAPELYHMIKKNKKLKNIKKGCRCFILGNGPSLKNVDLSRLEKEFVFSVNFFNKVDGFEKAKPNVHLVIDADAFDLREDVHTDRDDNIKCFTDMGKLKNRVVLILPSSGYKWSLENGINRMFDIRYIHVSKDIRDRDIENIDLTKGSFAFATVVQYAIEVAIYMGFSEIYLLGCDATILLQFTDMILEGKISEEYGHAYGKDVDGQEDAARQILQTWSMNKLMYEQYMFFWGYQRLRDYCDKHNIVIRNCTEKSLITEIEKEDLNAVLTRK